MPIYGDIGDIFMGILGILGWWLGLITTVVENLFFFDRDVKSLDLARLTTGGRDLLQLQSADRIGENGRIRSLSAAGFVPVGLRWVISTTQIGVLKGATIVPGHCVLGCNPF